MAKADTADTADTRPSPGAALPLAVQRAHEWLAWLIPLLDHFPRARRFTLGERLETGSLAVLEDLVDAAWRRDKREVLQRANRRLAVLRHLWRLAWELGTVNLRRYEHGIRMIDDLGRQIGGWLRSQAAPE